MSKIEDIDTSKPIEFYGSKTTLSDEPFLVEMAARTGLDNFRNVTGPVTESTMLAIEDGQRLLDYLRTCCWRADFDKDLQCIAENKMGEALLNGWMSIETFSDFVKATSQDGSPVQDVSVTLGNMIMGWAESGVEQVDFVGYRRAA